MATRSRVGTPALVLSLLACACACACGCAAARRADGALAEGAGDEGSGAAAGADLPGSGGDGGKGGIAQGAAGAGGAGGAGPEDDAEGTPATQVVNAGELAASPSYSMVFTLGQPTPLQGRAESPSYRLQGGLAGANGDSP